MNVYQKLACTLLLALGLLLGAVALSVLKTDLQFYLSMQPVQVTVQKVHLHSESSYLEDIGPAVHVTFELELATPDGERSVQHTETLSPEPARRRMAELQALQGKAMTLFLSKDVTTRFSFQRQFNWGSTLALTFILVLLILPPVLAFGWHRKNAKAHEQV